MAILDNVTITDAGQFSLTGVCCLFSKVAPVLASMAFILQIMFVWVKYRRECLKFEKDKLERRSNLDRRNNNKEKECKK